jgi:anti-sigma B factor antagonist
MANDADIDLHISEHGGIPVLSVRGEIDVASSPPFQASLSGLLQAESGTVIVDLSEVSFIDSTGLGALIEAEKRCGVAGKNLRLVVTAPHIRRLLELTGLDEILSLVASATDSGQR